MINMVRGCSPDGIKGHASLFAGISPGRREVRPVSHAAYSLKADRGFIISDPI